MKIQYNRNRYYDYYTGRWTTHDPLGYLDSMNLYEYVGSNPISHLDPMGLLVLPIPGPGAALKMKAISALKGFEKKHDAYVYYWVTGLQLTVSKLSARLNSLASTHYKPNTWGAVIAWYDPGPDFFYISATDPISGRTAFHEAIHVYCGVAAPGMSNRIEEGIAYGAEHMAMLVLPQLAALEDELSKPSPSIDELKNRWQRGWWLAKWGVIHGRGGYYAGESLVHFTVNTSDILLVDWVLGFELTCGGLAHEYNTLLKGKGSDECHKFVCTHAPTTCEIGLREALYWVFK